MAGQPETCEPEWVGAEHPLFLLYTSGSTGKPKGVQHSTGGYLLHAALTTQWTFDLKPGRRVLVHGRHRLGHRPHLHHLRPLALGGTEIVFEGVPTFPDAGRFWKMIQDHKVSIFYTAPTAIRSLIQGGRDHRGRASPPVRPEQPAPPGFGGRAHQPRGLGVVPPACRRRPLPHRRHLLADRDRRPHDHAAAGRHALVPGSCTLPFPGIQTAIVDETGNDVPNGQGGILVVKSPGRP